MDLLELIKTRRTIRKYKKKKVSSKVIETVIEAGRWAPSAHNFQPWKFVIVKNKNKIIALSDLLNQEADKMLSGFNLIMKNAAEDIRTAPVIIAAFTDGSISKKFNRFESPYDDIGKIYEIQSVSNAIENMLLYSHSEGLGMAWYGIVMFCGERISKLLGHPGQLVAVLSLGFPGENPKVLSRKTTLEITDYIR